MSDFLPTRDLSLQLLNYINTGEYVDAVQFYEQKIFPLPFVTAEFTQNQITRFAFRQLLYDKSFPLVDGSPFSQSYPYIKETAAQELFDYHWDDFATRLYSEQFPFLLTEPTRELAKYTRIMAYWFEFGMDNKYGYGVDALTEYSSFHNYCQNNYPKRFVTLHDYFRESAAVEEDYSLAATLRDQLKVDDRFIIKKQ